MLAIMGDGSIRYHFANQFISLIDIDTDFIPEIALSYPGLSDDVLPLTMRDGCYPRQVFADRPCYSAVWAGTILPSIICPHRHLPPTGR